MNSYYFYNLFSAASFWVKLFLPYAYIYEPWFPSYVPLADYPPWCIAVAMLFPKDCVREWLCSWYAHLQKCSTYLHFLKNKVQECDVMDRTQPFEPSKSAFEFKIDHMQGEVWGRARVADTKWATKTSRPWLCLGNWGTSAKNAQRTTQDGC